MTKQPMAIQVLLVVSLTLNIAYVLYRFDRERKQEKKKKEKRCSCNE